MNKNTLDFYNENAKSYEKTTLSVDMSESHVNFAEQIPIKGKILDIGCGAGRDLMAFKKMGYDVVGLDASEELVKIAQKNANVKVYHKSFMDINWENEFDGIWCIASLLHIPKKELPQVLEKITSSLKENGIFYATFKQGSSESYDEKNRFFSYYELEELKEIFEKFPQLNVVIEEDKSKDKLGRLDTTWLNVSAVKNELNLNKVIKMKI